MLINLIRLRDTLEACIHVYKQLLVASGILSIYDAMVDAISLIKSWVVTYSNYGICGNSIMIDASSVCQLKCHDCIQSSGEFGILKRGFLSYEDFKLFINDNPGFKSIELSSRGEILLNPYLKKMVEYAYMKGIKLTAKNGVNLNSAADGILEHLVRYKFNALSVSIDGASNATYGMYRINGNFDRVIENVRKINEYKQIYKSKHPRLYWQFVLFGHNEHEIPKAKQMASDLNMIFAFKYNALPSYSPIINKDVVKRETGLVATSSIEHEELTGEICFLPCFQLWISPQISVDGKLVGCCINSWGDYGNAFENGLRSCVMSEKYRYAKRMILDKAEPRSDVPCSECRYYKIMRESKRLGRKGVILNSMLQIIPDLLKAAVFEYKLINQKNH